MLVADFVVDDQRRGVDGGAFAMLFALNMRVFTPDGDTFTFKEYRQWGKEAGFRRFETVDIPAPSPIMVFRK